MILAMVLEIVIGLTFIFLILSLITTWLQELIATLLKLRSKHLYGIVKNLLDPSAEKPKAVKELAHEWGKYGNLVKDKLQHNVVKAFYEHPLIRGLRRRSKGLPSYIPSREFSNVIFDLLTKAGTEETPTTDMFNAIKRGIDNMGNEVSRNALRAIANATELAEKNAEKQIALFRKQLANWFDSSMDRASGWYKRNVQIITLIIGLIMAVGFNVDTIAITRDLWQDTRLREKIAIEVEIFLEEKDAKKVEETVAKLEDIGLPIGWQTEKLPESAIEYLLKILGWALAALAASQGSHIWFDVLNRLVNMRGTGKKPRPAETG